jgi:hypothetical protein
MNPVPHFCPGLAEVGERESARTCFFVVIPTGARSAQRRDLLLRMPAADRPTQTFVTTPTRIRLFSIPRKP